MGQRPLFPPFQEKFDDAMGGGCKMQVSRERESENKNVGAVLVSARNNIKFRQHSCWRIGDGYVRPVN